MRYSSLNHFHEFGPLVCADRQQDLANMVKKIGIKMDISSSRSMSNRQLVITSLLPKITDSNSYIFVTKHLVISTPTSGTSNWTPSSWTATGIENLSRRLQALERNVSMLSEKKNIQSPSQSPERNRTKPGGPNIEPGYHFLSTTRSPADDA